MGKSLLPTMITPLLLLCSLFPLAASLSVTASTDNQYLHATVDWSTGALKEVQYLPAQAKYVSMNAPCFLQSYPTGQCDDSPTGPWDDCSTLMCRDKTEAFVAVCNLTSRMDPSNAFLDSSSNQLFAVRSDTEDHTSLFSMDLTTCAIRWDIIIPSLASGSLRRSYTEVIVKALGMPTGGGMLTGLASADNDLSFTIDTRTGNITSEKKEDFNEALDISGVAYDAARHLWLGLNITGGGKFGPETGINMFSTDADAMEKVKAFPIGAIPQSWIDQFPPGYPILTPASIILEGGKIHANFIAVQDSATGAYFNPLVTMDASTGKLLAAVEVQFPSKMFSIDALNPSWTGCPGGSLNACMELCPSSPPTVYKACVRTCGERCK